MSTNRSKVLSLRQVSGNLLSRLFQSLRLYHYWGNMTAGPLATLPDTPATQERRLGLIQQSCSAGGPDTCNRQRRSTLMNLSLVEMTGIGANNYHRKGKVYSPTLKNWQRLPGRTCHRNWSPKGCVGHDGQREGIMPLESDDSVFWKALVGE